MSRKPKISTDGAPPLSSNPFAALGGALGQLPSGTLADAPVAPSSSPSPSPEPEPLELRDKLVVRREKKGRGGKTATVIEGLHASPEQLRDMAQRLRRSLGCGAHLEGSTIVLTGAQTERIRDWLMSQGATRVVIGN